MPTIVITITTTISATAQTIAALGVAMAPTTGPVTTTARDPATRKRRTTSGGGPPAARAAQLWGPSCPPRPCRSTHRAAWVRSVTLICS